MISKPMDVLQRFPIRKSKKQKQLFRDAVQSYLKTIGYDSSIEKGSAGAKNIVIGNPEAAKYLITAHYDTPAGMPFPNLITPCSFWPFLLYQVCITLVLLLLGSLIGVACWLFISLICSAFGDDSVMESLIWGLSLLPSLNLLGVWIMSILILIGPANKHNANDNTSGVVTVLEIARSLPESYRDRVCFVLFDLEEAGLIGSSSYQKTHKKHTANQLVLNMDCVGDGNELVMFPTKKLLQNGEKMELLRSITGVWGEKSIAIREKGFAYYPSDQKNFPYGVGIAALRRSKWAGLYCSRIHTKKDTILEETNVNILRAAIVSMITCGAVK